MKRSFLILIVVLAVGWSAYSSVLFVDQAEYVYVTQFGAHVVTYDGRADAGLHLKAPWPFQSAQRFDRRLQVLDVPTQELLIRDRSSTPQKTEELQRVFLPVPAPTPALPFHVTANVAAYEAVPAGEPKSLPLTFDVYVCWRIADKTAGNDPVDRFVRSFGTTERAEGFLRSQIISRLKVEMSGLLVEQLVNTDPGRLRTEEVLRQLRLRPYLRGTDDPDERPLSLVERAQQVGIEIVDIRLRRFNHPVQVRDDIFAKIRKDREREANNYRLQGDEIAAAIRAEGELEARRIRTEAEAERIRLEGLARAEATRILNDAHKEAPEFYRLVRLLDGYKQMFADDKTQLILSLDHPLLVLFKDVPRVNGNGPTRNPVPGIGSFPPPNGNGDAVKKPEPEMP
jgi:membrane protease subunit HflC